MKTLFLICGLPNAGKTSLSSLFTQVIHDDECEEGSFPKEREEIIHKRLNRILETSDIAVIEGVFNSPLRRIPLIEGVNADKFICIYINIDFETSLERENRGRTKSVIRMFSSNFAIPDYNEGWDEIIEINNSQTDKQKIIELLNNVKEMK